VRAWLMCARSGHKTCDQVFLFWAQYSCLQTTRRIKMFRLRSHYAARQLRRLFTSVLEGVAVVRRRRQLHAKTSSVLTRCKVISAAEALIKHSRSCVRRRKVFQMLLVRHQSKLIQHAWGEWEMRLEVFRCCVVARTLTHLLPSVL
jgi:hypothetical protein